jgi:hypothetical protein
MDERTYSVAEANALLPQVRKLVEQMLAARAKVLELQPELWPAVEQAVFNGGGKAISQATRQILVIQHALGVLHRLNIYVKDINTGLVDFPARRNDQLVYLCWQYDEPSVQFWHDVDSGFAGRQRIDDAFD